MSETTGTSETIDTVVTGETGLSGPVARFYRVATRCGLTMTQQDTLDGTGPSYRIFRADDPMCEMRSEVFLYWTPPRDGHPRGRLSTYLYRPYAGRKNYRARKSLVRVSHRYAVGWLRAIEDPRRQVEQLATLKARHDVLS